MQRSELLGLFFQFTPGALQFFAFLVDLTGPFLELLLTLFQARVKAVEPHQVVLILLVEFLQGTLPLSQIFFPSDKTGP